MAILAARIEPRTARAACAAPAEELGEEIAEVRTARRAKSRPENSNPASQLGGGRNSWPA